MRAAGRVAAGKLLRDSFRYPENISGVLVVIAHQRLARALSIFFPVTQTPRDLLLLIKMKSVRRAFGEIMQIGPESQQKIVGALDPALVGFAQPIFPDQVGRG